MSRMWKSWFFKFYCLQGSNSRWWPRQPLPELDMRNRNIFHVPQHTTPSLNCLFLA